MNDTNFENSQQQPNDPTGEYLRWLTQSGFCAKLHSGQLALLMALAKYADWRTGTAYPSVSRLARDLDLDRGHVYRLLNQLLAEHLIEIVGTVPTAYDRSVRKWKLFGFGEASAAPDERPKPQSVNREMATAEVAPCALPSAAPAHTEQEQEPEPKPEQQQTEDVVVAREVNQEDEAQSRQAEVHGLLLDAGIDAHGLVELVHLDRDPDFVRALIAASRGARSPTGFIVKGMRLHFSIKRVAKPTPAPKRKASSTTIIDFSQFTERSFERIKERALLRVSPENRQKLAERPWTDPELRTVLQRYWQQQSEAA